MDYVNTIKEPTGSDKRCLADKILALYLRVVNSIKLLTNQLEGLKFLVAFFLMSFQQKSLAAKDEMALNFERESAVGRAVTRVACRSLPL